MKENIARRGFLRLAAAAPAAAVALKQQLVSDALAKHASINTIGNYMGAAGIPTPADGDADQMKWELGHLTNSLKNAIEEPYQYQMPAIVRASLRADGLRSVSPSIRAQIAHREASAIEQRERVSDMTKRVASIKKKLGILGVFL